MPDSEPQLKIAMVRLAPEMADAMERLAKESAKLRESLTAAERALMDRIDEEYEIAFLLGDDRAA